MSNATIVVLRFGGGMKVDIVSGLEPKAAIGKVAGHALSNGYDPPLLEAVTSELSSTRIAELYAGMPKQPPPLKEYPPVHVTGLLHAIGAYMAGLKGPDIDAARDRLISFFSYYGVQLNFDGEPDSPPAEESQSKSRKR